MSGDRIKSARLAKGLTQEQLGEMIGISGVAIMRYEKNQREPRQVVLYKIAKALDVSEAWLMGYDVPMKKSDEDLRIDSKKIEYFIKYLESLEYIVKLEAEDKTFTVTITKEKIATTMTEAEFEEFQETIKKSVEFEIFKASQK